MTGSAAELGRSMYATVRGTFLRTVIGSRSGEQVVALTFDDGPDPGSTPAILRHLARFDARATFFLLGQNVSAHPGLARAIAEGGHAIGTHAFTHRNLAHCDPLEVIRELRRCQRAIEDATGERPRIMRPPYGFQRARTFLMARALGLRVVHWSVSGEDWLGHPPEAVCERVLSAAAPGSVVLLHDGQPPTVAALPMILEGLSRRGHRFVTVPELLRLRPLATASWLIANA
jgi:peptidoglycan/xylan/chitin deacetylase (PgdA/CDA1 family)